MDVNLNLELTDHCNIKCKMCSQSMRDEAHGVPMRFMSWETWRDSLRGLADMPDDVHLCPHWLGEPTLHPRFDRFVEYAFRANQSNRLFRSFKLHTNGVLFDEELRRHLREPRPKRKLHRQVIKHRVRVCSTERWHELPASAPWDHVQQPADRMDRERWERWCSVVREQSLDPMCRVEYLRETFAHGQLRLTLDHRVCAVATSDSHALRGPCPQRLIPDGWVVLELKYNGQAPRWMRRLVSRFGLVAEPISKFALGIARTCRQSHASDRRSTTPPSILRSVDKRAAK